MKHRSNIMSFLLMAIVLLLGVFMPSLPNLDDGDENVGCAAVLPLAARKSAVKAAHDEPKQRQGTSVAESNTVDPFAAQAIETIAPAIIVLTQIRPPLRP